MTLRMSVEAGWAGIAGDMLGRRGKLRYFGPYADRISVDGENVSKPRKRPESAIFDTQNVSWEEASQKSPKT